MRWDFCSSSTKKKMDRYLRKHMRGSRGEVIREEVTERGRKGERDRESPLPLMEQASAMLFPLITLMTNLKQLKSHFWVSLLFLSFSPLPLHPLSIFSPLRLHLPLLISLPSFICCIPPLLFSAERWYIYLCVCLCPPASCPFVCIKYTKWGTEREEYGERERWKS